MTVSSDYNNVKGSATAALMNILKGNIGTGILSMPIAFRNSGIIAGIITLPLIGFICIHAMFLLLSANRKLSEKLKLTELSYEETAEKAFEHGPVHLRPYARFFGKLICLFVTFAQFGIGVAYILFVADSLQTVLSNYLKGTDKIEIVFCIMACFPLMVALNLIKTLKHLAIASMIANLLQGIGLVVVLINLVQDLPPITTVKYTSWGSFPLYFGTAFFTFEGIPIVIPIKESMKRPEKFGGPFGVLSMGMLVVILLNCCIGFLGYLKFGDGIESSVTINLPSMVIYDVVRLMFALAVFLSYPLQMFVPINTIWPLVQDRLPSKWQKMSITNTFYRASLIFLSFFIAAYIPHLDLIISLIGALCSSAIAVIFPPIIHYAVVWQDRERYGLMKWTWIRMRSIALLIFGLVGFFYGTYASISAIWKAPS